MILISHYTKTKSLGIYDINDNLLKKQEEEEFCSKIDDFIDQYDVVITVDYGHGLLTPKIINQIENKSNYTVSAVDNCGKPNIYQSGPN